MKKYILIVALFIFSNLSYSSVVVINGLTHIYSGNSGDQMRGEIILLNTSNEEQRVSFDLKDAIFSCTGSRIFTNEQTHHQSSLEWFDGSLMDKILDPKEKYVYRFAITIPKDKALKGSYWTSLMIDVEKPIKKDKLSKNIGLDTKVRYAIGLLTNVNSLDEVSLDFQKMDVDKSGNNKKLKVKLTNQNLFIEGVKLSLEIYDSNGKNILETATARNMVFPGFCKDYSFDISSLPKGNYECLLVADSRNQFLGTNISLTIE
ncbi:MULTISPECIES: hypothetical protein [unclassified Flavobacterium]|uniref:hypothetical protein n=1 Tax=unclassified Flavobacterium TaxID=196869 RepID=UPI003F91A3EC